MRNSKETAEISTALKHLGNQAIGFGHSLCRDAAQTIIDHQDKVDNATSEFSVPVETKEGGQAILKFNDPNLWMVETDRGPVIIFDGRKSQS